MWKKWFHHVNLFWHGLPYGFRRFLPLGFRKQDTVVDSTDVCLSRGSSIFGSCIVPGRAQVKSLWRRFPTTCFESIKCFRKFFDRTYVCKRVNYGSRAAYGSFCLPFSGKSPETSSGNSNACSTTIRFISAGRSSFRRSYKWNLNFGRKRVKHA